MSKQFYNYIYLDPRKPKVQEIPGTFVILTHEPFYVGKGSGDRSETKTKLGYHSRYNPYLANKISKIESNALEVLCIKINAGSEKEALDREQYLIRLLGREDRKKGTLLNLSDGGEVRPTDNAVKVYQINKDTLELIFVHESFREAAKIAGGSLTRIYSTPYCQVKGCFWLFEDQYEKGDDFIRDYQQKHLEQLRLSRIQQNAHIGQANVAKSIVRICPTTGERVNFESSKIAALALNLKETSSGQINRAIRGELKSAYGFKWEHCDGK